MKLASSDLPPTVLSARHPTSRATLAIALTTLVWVGSACGDSTEQTRRDAGPLGDGQVGRDNDDDDGNDDDDDGDSQARVDAGLNAAKPIDGGKPTSSGTLDAGRASDAGANRDASSPVDGGATSDAARADGGGLKEIGPSACLPQFKAACSPQIVFKNDEPTGRGALFDELFPDPQTTMQDVTCTVCSILFRSPDEIPQRNRHQTVNLTLRDNPNLADASGNSIRVDLKHIAGYKDKAKALLEFRGVLVHETAHLYQHYGNGGLGEGMADFVRIRVGLYERGRRRTGGAWTDPYTTSGFFFSWLAGPGIYHPDGREPHNVDIGYLINKTIGEQGADAVPGLMMRTFGSDVDKLWQEYQTAIR
jgi:hypothetical protein